MRVLLCLSWHYKLQQKTWAITLLECTTIYLKEIPHFFTICNCSFLCILGDINRTIYPSPLLTHTEPLSAVQPLFVLIHGISSRKKQQEKGRLASWNIPCAMSAQTLSATLPMARAKASTGSNPSALTQGQNQLSTSQNRASPFHSNKKCVFCHCKHPGVILHASDPSSYLQTSALCWQTSSCKALQCSPHLPGKAVIPLHRPKTCCFRGLQVSSHKTCGGLFWFLL